MVSHHSPSRFLSSYEHPQLKSCAFDFDQLKRAWNAPRHQNFCRFPRFALNVIFNFTVPTQTSIKLFGFVFFHIYFFFLVIISFFFLIIRSSSNNLFLSSSLFRFLSNLKSSGLVVNGQRSRRFQIGNT